MPVIKLRTFFAAALASAIVAGSVCLSFGSDNHSPSALLNEAVFCSNFATDDDGALILSDGVELGVSISDTDRTESLARGGDGLVARFKKGGHILFSKEVNDALKITGSEITFGLRVKCAPEVWGDSPLMSKHGGHEKLAFNLFYLEDKFGVEVGTTGNNSLISKRAPRGDMLDPDAAVEGWHDVYCRVDSAKMEFFVNGRCYIEDFVLGELRTNDVPFVVGAQYDSEDSNAKPRPGFEGEIDFVAVWDRALTDEEIIAMSGGPDRADLRQRTERAYPESLNYWTPPNDYGVGDCMPFCVDGVFHFMYLLDINRHGAKNGLGAHQWIQATSSDLKNWTHQPFVLPIDDQNEGSICTGSVFYDGGTYYAFYANRAVEYVLPTGERKNTFGLLCMATSSDGIHFEKQDPQPLFLLPEGYGQGTRDPVVFKSSADGRFHMYATTNYLGKGCWAHAVSDDLKNWELLDPVYTHKAGEPECPDWFQWGDDYYVIANHLNGYYKKSKSPLGPWEVPNAPNILLNGAVNVPKTAPAPFGDDRRIICGWTRERGFGGSAVFHELIRYEDGTLGEKFVPEMTPETLAPVVAEKNVDAFEPKTFETPERFRLRMALSFDPENVDKMRDVILQYAVGGQIRVVFSDRAVTLNGFRIECVDFTTGRLELDVIATHNIVDVCVNESRTVTDANREPQLRTLWLSNEADKFVTIDSFEVAPLK
jgi:beta-fructofuranosidase